MSKYAQIDQDINRFLVGKSLKNPFNFIPFEVKILPKQQKQNGLSQLRSLYSTAYSIKKHTPNYMNSIKTQRRFNSFIHTQQTPSLNKQKCKTKTSHSVLLQHLYSHQYLQTKNTQHSQSPHKKKLSVIQNKAGLLQDNDDDLFRTTVCRFKNFLKTQKVTRVKDFISSKRSRQNRSYSSQQCSSFITKRHD